MRPIGLRRTERNLGAIHALTSEIPTLPSDSATLLPMPTTEPTGRILPPVRHQVPNIRIVHEPTGDKAARSHMQVARELAAHGYPREAAPGVYDIHSPRVPSAEQAVALLREGLEAIPAGRL